MREFEVQAVSLERRQKLLRAYVEETYRKPTADEMDLLKPVAAQYTAYADVLKLSDSGLIKLVPDAGCNKSTEVVNASDACLKYSMPGHGSSYSFRTKNYRIPRLSDISLSDGAFLTPGFWVRGILSVVGDVPIERIDLNLPGIRYLRDYKPSVDFAEVVAADKTFAKGVSYNGQVFARALKAVPNMTYVLRSIAYRGEYKRTVAGLVFDEFSYDDRKDVLIVFRIAAVDPDGAVTIVWRQLFSQGSPKLSVPAKDKTPPADKKFFGMKTDGTR